MKTLRDLRGTWPRALLSLASALLLIFAIRWALIEPYVIPSESMVPTLLVHDHIFVNKFAYGLRLPFASDYLFRYSTPKRGEILVFRSLEDDGLFLIKRVVGLPGDEIQIKRDGLWINGVKADVTAYTPIETQILLADWSEEARTNAIEQNAILRETFDSGGRPKSHPVFRDNFDLSGDAPAVRVPEGHIFMSGDNRDHSADSRIWGTLPIDRVLGRASMIWLSCEEALAQTQQLCNPQTMRWHRLFKWVE